MDWGVLITLPSDVLVNREVDGVVWSAQGFDGQSTGSGISGNRAIWMASHFPMGVTRQRGREVWLGKMQYLS